MDGRLPTFKDRRLQAPEYVLDIEAINAQVADLEIEAKNFAAFLRGPDHMAVVASRARLRSLVISWKHDLNRFRAFYLDNSYPDDCKQAAHFVYWCGKVKPLTLSPDAYTFSCIAINEAFALHVAMYRFLGVQPDEIDDKRYRTLLRQLYYRPTDPIQLSVSLEWLRDAVGSKRAAARP